MVDRKLDIFAVLTAANKKNVKFYDQLSLEEQKALQPLVVMRWLSGTDDEAQVIMLNEFVNKNVFPLGPNKKLLWQLLTISTGGYAQRCNWIKAPGKTETKKPIATALLKRAYGYNDDHAADALKLLDIDDLIDFAFDYGMPPDEITKLKKEMKK